MDRGPSTLWRSPAVQRTLVLLITAFTLFSAVLVFAPAAQRSWAKRCCLRLAAGPAAATPVGMNVAVESARPFQSFWEPLRLRTPPPESADASALGLGGPAPNAGREMPDGRTTFRNASLFGRSREWSLAVGPLLLPESSFVRVTGVWSESWQGVIHHYDSRSTATTRDQVVATETDLDKAKDARDKAAPGAASDGKKVVIGGYKDGKIVVGCNANPTGCAEDDVDRQLGGPADGYTTPIDPATGRPVRVCPRCKEVRGSSKFEPGTKGAPGPWKP